MSLPYLGAVPLFAIIAMVLLIGGAAAIFLALATSGNAAEDEEANEAPPIDFSNPEDR
jgi:hypothetical protein